MTTAKQWSLQLRSVCNSMSISLCGLSYVDFGRHKLVWCNWQACYHMATIQIQRLTHARSSPLASSHPSTLIHSFTHLSEKCKGYILRTSHRHRDNSNVYDLSLSDTYQDPWVLLRTAAPRRLSERVWSREPDGSCWQIWLTEENRGDGVRRLSLSSWARFLVLLLAVD